MSIELLCTLGPASLNERVIKRLSDLGVALFRINLSHTEIADVASIIELIQRHTVVPVCLDTEGAQVRNGALTGGTAFLTEHALIRACRAGGAGNSECFSFYPDFVVDMLEVGDFVSIDFNAVLVQVIAKERDGVTMRILNGGLMGQNKAVTVDRNLPLPPLTAKDRAAIEIGKGMGIRHFALSFANSGEDVDLLREIVGPQATIISKIECRNGLNHLSSIANRSDAILIDRGDLSREVPIEQIPLVQQDIIRQCGVLGRKVYVATNLLESMIQHPGPTRAEVNDVVTTLASGASGLVLAAETAIGVNPIASANMIVRLIHAFEAGKNREQDRFYIEDSRSLLIAPHGGRLVHRVADPSVLERIGALRRLAVRQEDLMDCEQIALGTYSPLTGFMDREAVTAVLNESRLPSGPVWPMPVLLPLEASIPWEPAKGESIVLCDMDMAPRALLMTSEVFTLDLEKVALQWFSTLDRAHPGVAKLVSRGNRFVAGEITLIDRGVSPYRHYELTPAQTRAIFVHKGWTRVVGFHTRNPAHRVHEHLQLTALATTHADGLYISPVIGPKKTGDFLPGPVMQSYQILLRSGVYPEGKVVLGSFSTYSRFAGPREAIFTALCRKNMGCSHFIIGRDHAGVGNYYDINAVSRYFDELGDIGIELVFFDAMGYDEETEGYLPLVKGSRLATISGTQVRESLRQGQRLPGWFMRDSIQDMLLGELAAGHPIFSA